MPNYQLTGENWIHRLDDDSRIAADSENADYVAYLEWLAAGNTPLPAPPPPPDQVIPQLWQAAHDYEYAEISGSAIGLLAMGVMLGKPKCLAVQGWVKSIWSEYYTRKAAVNPDYDFSIVGACPHSVPELMAELGL